MTPTTTPTVDQLETLRGEAARAGDDLQVDLCDRAIEGDAEALAECAAVIANAAAQDDDQEADGTEPRGPVSIPPLPEGATGINAGDFFARQAEELAWHATAPEAE